MIFIHTSCAKIEEAEKLGKMIIEKKLGVCVHYWPIKSMFNWKDKFENVEEVMMAITTFEGRLEQVNDLISEHHSYSTPMIAGIDVRRINRAYKEWMMQEVS